MLPEQNEIKLIELFQVCTKCKIPKVLRKFSKEKYGRFGVAAVCKACRKVYHAQYRKINLKQIAACGKKYRKANLKRLIAYGKQYRQNNAKKIKVHRLNHKKHKKAYDKIYNQIHKDKIMERQGKKDKKRRQFDPKFRLNRNIKCAIGNSLKGNKNGRHWETLVNYTLNKLKKHLEKRFTEGMTWENYGRNGWHIDHKIPISVFNFTKPEHEDFKKCWALKNLQPLWECENISKSNKITTHFQPALLI